MTDRELVALYLFTNRKLRDKPMGALVGMAGASMSLWRNSLKRGEPFTVHPATAIRLREALQAKRIRLVPLTAPQLEMMGFREVAAGGERIAAPNPHLQAAAHEAEAAMGRKTPERPATAQAARRGKT